MISGQLHRRKSRLNQAQEIKTEALIPNLSQRVAFLVFWQLPGMIRGKVSLDRLNTFLNEVRFGCPPPIARHGKKDDSDGVLGHS